MAIIEVCANSLASALAAQKGGASRIELCENLIAGGTTPGYGTLKLVRERLDIQIHVLIRPRQGDFHYTDDEFEVMLQDVKLCKQLGIDGIVVGCLKPDGSFDLEKMAILKETAWPMSANCHRAFDMCCNPFHALDELINLGYDRILTAGQQNSVPEGIGLIKELVNYANGRIVIMPGSGIREYNILQIMAQTGAIEFHLTGHKTVESKMKYRQESIFMGGIPEVPEYSVLETDAEVIRRIVDLVS